MSRSGNAWWMVLGARLGIAVVSLSVACVREDAGAEEESPAEVMEVWARVVCEGQVGCGCANAGPVEACVSSDLGWFEGALATAEERGLGFDPSCARARMARYELLGCAPDWRDAGERVACSLFVGERELGEACEGFPQLDADECRSGLACRGGVCTEPVLHYPLGAECFLSWPHCSGDAHCSDLDNNGQYICVRYAYPGEPCPTGLCAVGDCDPDTLICSPGVAEGGACGVGAFCGKDLYCGDEGVCVGFPPLGQLGDPCTVGCDEGLVCDMFQDVCVLPPPYTCWGGGVEIH